MALVASLFTTNQAQASTCNFESLFEAVQPSTVQNSFPPILETPEQVRKEGQNLESALKQRLRTIIDRPIQDVTIHNTLVAIESIMADMASYLSRWSALLNSHPNQDYRAAAMEASDRLYPFYDTIFNSQNLYKKIQTFEASPLAHELQLIVQDLLSGYRRGGIALDEDQRQKYEAWSKELREVEAQYREIIFNRQKGLMFSKAELEGVPDNILGQMEYNEATQKYRLWVNFSSLTRQVLTYAKHETTRKSIELVSSKLHATQTYPLFQRAVVLRQKLAEVLGYQSWAHYKLQPTMSGSPERVLQFYKDIEPAIFETWNAEKAALTELKRKDLRDPDARLESWDLNYYQRLIQQQQRNEGQSVVTSQTTEDRFEFEHVLKETFEIFDELFDVRFKEVTDQAYTWVDGLRVFALIDKETGEALSYMYLDPYPRPGKPNNCGVHSLEIAQTLPTRRVPAALLVCDFPRATDNSPSLLTEDQVKTIFHELGHIVHSGVSKAKYYSNSSDALPRDYTEAPSQLLENWLREPSIRRRLLGSSSASGPIETFLTSPQQAVTFGRGLTAMRSYYRSMADLHVHLGNPNIIADPLGYAHELSRRVFLPQDHDNIFSNWIHIMWDYDAVYNGYAWSEAFSKDIFSVFQQSPRGVLDPQLLQKMKTELYESGGLRSANESLEAFLGRPWSVQPYIDYVRGITP